MKTQPHNDSKSLIQSYGPWNDISLPLKCKWAWNHPLTICPITCKANPLICTYLSLEAPSHFPYWDYFFQWYWDGFNKLLFFWIHQPRENPFPYISYSGHVLRPNPLFLCTIMTLSCPAKTNAHLVLRSLAEINPFQAPHVVLRYIYYPRHINFLRSLFRAVGMRFMRQLS